VRSLKAGAKFRNAAIANLDGSRERKRSCELPEKPPARRPRARSTAESRKSARYGWYRKSQMADTETPRNVEIGLSATFVPGLGLAGPGCPDDRALIKTHRTAEPEGPSHSSSWQKR
jgi:hypothetical protein